VRILHVIQEMRTGGAERVVVSLTQGATAAGHSVAIAAVPGRLWLGLPAERFPIRMLRRRPWLIPRNAWALHSAIRAWRPDIVHAHNPGMAAVTALPTLRGRRPPALVSVHGVPEEDWDATAKVVRLSGLPAVACGPGVDTPLRERGCRVLAMVPNGVGPAPPPADRTALEKEWGLSAGTPLIVSVGRLVHAKNQALAVRALAHVPGAALAILGDGPLRDELEREARAAGVADRLVLAGLRADAREVIGAADAVVISSRAEGLPLVALETLAAGTPLIATGVRGLRELLTDGRDALLVAPDDADALAAALRRVLEDRAVAERLGAEGRRVAAANAEDAMVASYLALYETITAA
jgi:glycosyltransferase involved in cell wall biosynthesis